MSAPTKESLILQIKDLARQLSQLQAQANAIVGASQLAEALLKDFDEPAQTPTKDFTAPDEAPTYDGAATAD